MSKFAPVAPLAIHRLLADANPALWGDYHLLIASEILKDPIGNNRFWTQLGSSKIVIVDNGVIEQGEAVPLEQLVAAAILVDANVVVVPDVIGDKEATLEAAEIAVPKLRRMLPPDVHLMGVAQGATLKEVWTCLNELDALGVGWLSIPKGFQERGIGNRAEWLEIARIEFPRHLHVLGFSDDYVNDVAAAQYAWGIDSAMPIWLSAWGIELPDSPSDFTLVKRRPPDYMEWKGLGDAGVRRVLRNIVTVHGWLNGVER